MISRLTAAAACFAILSAATITFAASTNVRHGPASAAAVAPASTVIELPRVMVTGRRLPS